MKEILKVINPVRVLKVKEDWIKVAEMFNPTIKGMSTSINDSDIAIRLLQRYESLTSQPLRKEMFVCEVAEPVRIEPMYHVPLPLDYDAELKYQQAQSKVWFDGFEEDGLLIKSYDEKLVINIMSSEFNYWTDGKEVANNIDCELITVFDLIIEIDRYNRTAQEPIRINFTENFVRELIESEPEKFPRRVRRI